MGVWTGYDNLKDGTISGIGQQSAQLMYRSMMSYLMQDKENVDWQKPNSVIRARIINNSNPPEVATSNRSSSWQLFVRGHAPSGVSDNSANYDEEDEEADTNNQTANVTASRETTRARNNNGSLRQSSSTQSRIATSSSSSSSARQSSAVASSSSSRTTQSSRSEEDNQNED